MAVSSNSYAAVAEDLTWVLPTGEEVSLKINTDLFRPDGHLKAPTEFSADKDNQLFYLTWPILASKCVSTLSQWKLVVSKAATERIASFTASTAESLGGNKWEVVKSVVAECRGKFRACLLSMSCRKIVFAHEDRQSAEKMKDSNEMVDIMNTLLADLEYQFRDVMVDWEVEITPINVSRSYQRTEVGEQHDSQLDSFTRTDAHSLPVVDSEESKASPVSEEVPPYFQQLLDLIAAESRKTQDALQKMAEENSHRHRIICQKLEELKSLERQQHPDYFSTEETAENQSEMVTTQLYSIEKVDLIDSIPSAELFERPASDREEPASPRSPGYHDAARNEQNQSPPLRHEHNHPPPRLPAEQSSPSSRERKQHDKTSRNLDSTAEVLKKDPVKPSETFRDTLSGSDLENRNLDEAVERAIRHDDDPAPKAKSYYTILCLDVSESMKKHGAFEEMKQVVETFIDGVEDIVSTTDVEENIGVVTFGGTSNVVQNLTNDFFRVRNAVDNIELGGRSPFVQALLVSMAAFVDKACVRCVNGYDIRPRIIFISDGYPTENFDDGGPDYAYNKIHVRSALTKIMMDFARKEKYTRIRPVTYIPVGKNPDKELMKSMATLSSGVYMEPGEVKKLCGYFLVQETIAKTLRLVERGDSQQSEEHLRALVLGLMPDLNEEQKTEVVQAIMEEQKTPSRRRSVHRKSDLEDMYENTDRVNAGEMLPLGTRVVRGPDWNWENQDGGGPGTVISHSDKKGWTYVCWDFGDSHNRYGYGPEFGYDIWRTDIHPRLMSEDQEMKIGMTVQKGPDWCYQQDESVRDVRYGIVIRKSRKGKKLMVRWDNAVLQVVRWGADDNKYDVMYCDPREIPQQERLEFRSSSAMPPPSHYHPAGDRPANLGPTEARPASAPDFEHGQWQWRDEHQNWNDYPPKDNAYIEENYKIRPTGSCLVTRDGKSRRIMFRRKTERTVDGGVECPVQRIPL